MGFLNPAILAALAVAITPIILHFLYRRRKQYVEFSSVEFLKQLEKQQRIKTSWLEYLLLLLRILTVASLVLAFSQPLSEFELPFSSRQKEYHYLAVQNDRYLNIRTDQSTLGRQLRAEVSNWLERCSDTDVFFFVSLSRNTIEAIDSKQILAKLTDEPIVRLQTNSIEDIEALILSDVAERGLPHYKSHYFGITLPRGEAKQSELRLGVDHQSTLENINILDAKIEQSTRVASAPLSLQVSLNHFPKDLEMLVVVDNKTVFQGFVKDSLAQFSIGIGGFENGIHQGYAKLLVDDAYLEDNTRFFSFEIQKPSKTLVLLDQENSVLGQFFKAFPDSSFESKVDLSANALRYSLNQYQTVFFHGNLPNQAIEKQLLRYIEAKSGYVVFVPALKLDALSWNRSNMAKLFSYSKTVGTLDSNQVEFQIHGNQIQSKALPNFYQFYQEEQQSIRYTLMYPAKSSSLEPLIGSKNRPFLSVDKEHQLFVFSVPFDQRASNFIYDARFVPLVYGLLYAQKENVLVDDSLAVLTLTTPSAKPQLILEGQRTYALDLAKRHPYYSDYALPLVIENGNYTLAIDNELRPVSINDPSVDLTQVLNQQQIVRSVEPSQGGQFQHWRLFLLIAFICYFLELWLGRATS